ncbi:MAG TPA: hypothetical protein VF587_13410 [Solirubrobacteraceae bacterium]
MSVSADDRLLALLAPWAVRGERSIAPTPHGGGRPTLLTRLGALEDAVTFEGRGLLDVEAASEAHAEALSAGLGLIEEAWPALGEAIGRSVRHVVLFRDPARNSFATPAAHGIAFINTALGTSDVFFVEDLAHQGGHVLFEAAWEGAPALVSVAPEASVGELAGSDDARSLEVAVHGMVTLTLMIGALRRVLASDAAVDRDEATGRLLFALVRLGTDLRALAGLPVYAEAGVAVMREVVGAYMEAARAYGELVVAADFTGQPYNFDLALFRRRNAELRAPARA